LKILSLINKNKRIAIALLTILFCVVMFLPIANLVVEDGNNSKTISISVGNTFSLIRDIKTKLGIEEVDIKGIDMSNPKDSYEATTIALHQTVTLLDFAGMAALLSIVLAIMSALIVYVKPNSRISLVLMIISPILLVSSGVSSVEGCNIINSNIQLFKEYFGLDQMFLGVSFNLSPLLFIAVSFLIILVTLNALLRKPKSANNEFEKLAKSIIFICALVCVLSVAFITLFLILKGVPTIAKIGFFNFIFTSEWDPVGAEPKFGIANMIWTSFFGTFGAVLFGVPIGLLTAVFISQLTPPRVSSFLAGTVNLLAGIPSVIYGAVGAILLVPFIQKVFNLPTGMTLFTAIIVLAVMVLPTITSVTTASLNQVPKTYMEASLALGITREASIFRILIPMARSGIMTGILLGLGRAIGEAMAILLVAGNVPGFPKLLEPARFLTTGIVAEMGYATGLHRDVLFAIGLVLFFFILIINSFFKYLIKKAGAKYE